MVSSQQAVRCTRDSAREFIESPSRLIECEPAFLSTGPNAAFETTVTTGFQQMQPSPIQPRLIPEGEEATADVDQGFGHGGPLFIAVTLVTLTFWTLAILSAAASLPLHLLNQPW